ncbi:GGDEF domain-containing protein [Exiguobacterium sp. RIT452]|uniref:GGDEF domain-containing protein n=1 Tax=Exiguobacterium sp. RIT452 TaxID=2315552 RepID=UPI000E76756C|nr:diguanylate cyclase [Exiguobacterium sp. RIT452]RJO96348.1 GGDEF domain-containing protein [Exiguobacterium sp. RIT452]
MLSQFNQFLLNFSLLITSLLFAFLPLRHTERISADSPIRTRLVVGLIAGLIGGLLVLNSITYDGAKIDLRLVALVTAYYYGGWVSGGITMTAIIGARFLVTPPGVYEGLILATLICLALLVTASIYRRFAAQTFKDYLVLLGVGIGYSLPALYLLTDTFMRFLEMAFVYIIFNLFGGYVTYRFLQELRKHFQFVQTQQELALTDGLTNLANRRKLDETLAHYDQHGYAFSVLIVDIDFFKSVNDTYGHDGGDVVLRQLSHLLQHCSPDEAVVGRYGGEEFVVLLPDMPLKEAVRLGETIRLACADQHFVFSTYPAFHVTLSIGAASSDQGETSFEVVQKADQSLYQAKQTGRNKVVGYSEE